MSKMEINDLFGPPNLGFLAENLGWQKTDCGIERFKGINFGDEIDKRSIVFREEGLVNCEESISCEIVIEERKTDNQVQKIMIVGQILSKCFDNFCDTTKVMLAGYPLQKDRDKGQSSYSFIIKATK